MQKESLLFFSLPSESTLFKGANKRGKCKRKARFSFHCRAKVPYLKVRISEGNAKGKLAFLFIAERKYRIQRSWLCSTFVNYPYEISSV